MLPQDNHQPDDGRIHAFTFINKAEKYFSCSTISGIMQN
jgi:hypothetical protein